MFVLIRFIWIVVVSIGIVLGVITVAKIFENWADSPVTVNIHDDTHPLSAIKFPAITVCPDVKVDKDKFINEVCRLE
jgi:hypothetical protein